MAIKDTELMQTRVPYKAFTEAKKLALKDGVSVAAWLRRLILRETKVAGDGTSIQK